MTGSRYGIRYVTHGLLVGAESAWSWSRLPAVPYEFLGETDRDALLAWTTLALAGLSGCTCHFLLVPAPVDVERWAGALAEATHAPTPGWPAYLDAQRRRLETAGYWERRVYLGIDLGGEGSARRRGWSTRMRDRTDLRNDGWRERAAALQRLVRGSPLRGEPVPESELRWLVRRSFWRGIAEPPANRCRPRHLADSLLLNSPRALRLEQPVGGAYLAFLAAARFPDVMVHPGAEWLAHADAVGFPVEVSVRFRLIPPRQASADAARMLAEASDQARHITGTSADLPLALLEATEQARQLEYSVTKENLPLVDTWARFVVAAPDAGQLEERVEQLVEAYRDLGIELARPRGDQLCLFLETLPGDRLRVRSFGQRQALVTLAAGMPHASAQLGDGQGPYLGETIGRSRLPVHFDPLAAARHNLPTAVAITGQPGAGKTNLAELLLYQLTLRGAWGLLVDPKNEADGLAALPDLGDVQVLRLGPEHAGLLDPFLVAGERWQGVLLAADVLRMLLPGELDAEHEAALLEACRLETESTAPSLRGVAERLAAGSPTARQFAETLLTVARLPLAQLCFADAHPRRVAPDRRLTILQLQGLSVPAAGTPISEYTLADRLAVTVLYLVAVLAGRLADAARSQAKVVVLDEAWTLTASRQGRGLVQRLARTGRSKNTALVLVSQNAADFLGPEVQNNFSAKFAFRSTQEDEVRAVCGLLGVEPTPQHLAAVRTLGNGECIFADLDGRVGAMRVDLILPALRTAFDTTPHPSPRNAPTLAEPELVP